MADLPHGSTVAGKHIIHQGIDNLHEHTIDDIYGFGDAAFKYIGAGGGLDADTLSGLHYTDLQKRYVRLVGDTIQSIRVNYPTSDLHAANLQYLEDNNPNMLNITAIGKIDEPLTITVGSPTSVFFSSLNILVSGFYYAVPFTYIDLDTIESPFINKVFYAYITITNNIAGYMISSRELENSAGRIQIATIETNSSTISSIETIEGMGRLGLEGYMLSNNRSSQSIPVANTVGKINDTWIPAVYSGKSTLVHPISVSAGSTNQCDITNYNQFSLYTVTVNVGIVHIDGGTIHYVAPDNSIENAVIALSRDGYVTTFNITIT